MNSKKFLLSSLIAVALGTGNYQVSYGSGVPEETAKKDQALGTPTNASAPVDLVLIRNALAGKAIESTLSDRAKQILNGLKEWKISSEGQNASQGEETQVSSSALEGLQIQLQSDLNDGLIVLDEQTDSEKLSNIVESNPDMETLLGDSLNTAAYLMGKPKSDLLAMTVGELKSELTKLMESLKSEIIVTRALTPEEAGALEDALTDAKESYLSEQGYLIGLNETVDKALKDACIVTTSAEDEEEASAETLHVSMDNEKVALLGNQQETTVSMLLNHLPEGLKGDDVKEALHNQLAAKIGEDIISDTLDIPSLLGNIKVNIPLKDTELSSKIVQIEAGIISAYWENVTKAGKIDKGLIKKDVAKGDTPIQERLGKTQTELTNIFMQDNSLTIPVKVYTENEFAQMIQDEVTNTVIENHEKETIDAGTILGSVTGIDHDGMAYLKAKITAPVEFKKSKSNKEGYNEYAQSVLQKNQGELHYFYAPSHYNPEESAKKVAVTGKDIISTALRNTKNGDVEAFLTEVETQINTVLSRKDATVKSVQKSVSKASQETKTLERQVAGLEKTSKKQKDQIVKANSQLKEKGAALTTAQERIKLLETQISDLQKQLDEAQKSASKQQPSLEENHDTQPNEEKVTPANDTNKTNTSPEHPLTPVPMLTEENQPLANTNQQTALLKYDRGETLSAQDNIAIRTFLGIKVKNMRAELTVAEKEQLTKKLKKEVQGEQVKNSNP